jgi:hypothetical protein
MMVATRFNALPGGAQYTVDGDENFKSRAEP